jgi:HK97 family phage major capsid protein
VNKEEILKLHKEAAIEAYESTVKERLIPLIGEESAKQVTEIVQKLQLQRQVYGKDMTGLSESQKKSFAKVAQALLSNGKTVIDTKANEALIEEQDGRGGYLVTREIADAILRIAASVGTIMGQATKWDMTSDELAVPNYTGAFLTGAFLGVDAPGTVTGLAFGQTQLIVKKWQLAFVVGNDLLADASVNIADWLLALGGEALANYVDYMGFVGGANTGDPFLGILKLPTSTTIQPNDQHTNQYILGGASNSGSTSFSKYAVMDDSSAMIGDLEESLLDGAAFYMNRTLWAKLRTQKDTAGNYILPFSAAANKGEPAIGNDAGGGPVKPAGEILGYPVYTNRWMPAVGASSVNGFSDTTSNPCVIFGNMRSMAFGDKGEMEVDQFTSGSFGGKEIALADQRGIVYRRRRALSATLYRAFVVGYTSSS